MSGRSRRRRGLAASIGVVLVAFALGCESPIHVTTDRDPDADFSGLTTYAWISPEPLIPQVAGRTQGPPISPIDDQRIRDAVAAELGSRGWKRLDSADEADLIVSYGLGSQERTEVYEVPDSGIYYHRGYRYGGWYSGSTIRTQQVIEGTLTLEFFDRQSRQAVWVGWASKRLSRSGSADREQTIQTAIEKILADFPALNASGS